MHVVLPAIPCIAHLCADSTQGTELEVLVDHTLEYELSIGNCIESCRWDENGVLDQ